MNRRNDYKMALLVDAVIHDTAAHAHLAAARHLAALGVPLEVAIRVLTRPAERRLQGEADTDIKLDEIQLGEVRRSDLQDAESGHPEPARDPAWPRPPG